MRLKDYDFIKTLGQGGFANVNMGKNSSYFSAKKDDWLHLRNENDFQETHNSGEQTLINDQRAQNFVDDEPPVRHAAAPGLYQ